jgi:adenine-specific DNA-methyltransferase
MIKDEIESVERSSPDLIADRTEQLRKLFPEVFSEGKVDFDKLKAALGESVDTQSERYTFAWAGKHDAIRALQTQSRATLDPMPVESVNFEDAKNLFIEGENLEALKLLYKSYYRRIKMIYIDPPYNTGNDFIYPDDYAASLDTYLKLTGQVDDSGSALTSKLEKSGRFHSAWLCMMYPRLFLARQLLQDDGVIFVSIDDHEVHNLRMLMNEIFGEENFVANVIWEKKYAPQNDSRWFSDTHDHILVYARNKEVWRPQLLPRTEEANARYINLDNDPRGPWKSSDFSVKSYSAKYDYPIKTPSGRIVNPPESRCWSVSPEQFQQLVADNRIWFGPKGNNAPSLKRFLSEVQEGMVAKTLWHREEVGDNQEAKQEMKALLSGLEVVFDTPKPIRLLKRMLHLATKSNEEALVLDFFAGSCSLAQAVIELNHEDNGNRRFIMIQLPEPTGDVAFPTIADMGKERIRRAIHKLQQEKTGKLDLTVGQPSEDFLNFRVFKMAPSNYRYWDDSEGQDLDTYASQMALFVDPLTPNWKPQDVIWEVALREGYGLNAHIEQISGIDGNAIYRVTDADKEQSFLICLDEVLNWETLKTLELTKDQLFVCRDVALDDELAANLALQSRLKTI